jgi:hypothetical protein
VIAHANVSKSEGRVAAFLMANVGLPFCLPCVAQELRLATPAVVVAAASLAGADRFKLTNRCCARCLSEQAVIYRGMR